MNPSMTPDEEYRNFKQLLKCFVDQWRKNANADGNTDRKDRHCGHGYENTPSGRRILNLYKNYREYKDFDLDCSFKSGCQLYSKANFINICGRWINILPVFDEAETGGNSEKTMKALQMGFGAEYNELNQRDEFEQYFKEYSIVSLDLFSPDEPNETLKEFFDKFREFIEPAKNKILEREAEKAQTKTKTETEKENETKENNVDTDTEQSATEETKSNENKRVTGGYNAIYYGVPGCGKSYYVQHEILEKKGVAKDHIERIVFYPDYTYSDFVGQITPREKDNRVKYYFVDGPFTRILKKANDDPEHMYYLVIEEINRGNAAAIFGDIFQLLDRDKDGTSEYTITNVDINENEQIEIPSNLTILATMNTSDQNVYTLDTAFQRRWEMHLIPNELDESDPLKEKTILDTDVTWEKFYATINKEITNQQSNQGLASTEDKRIGAHFVVEEDLEKPQNNDPARFETVISYLWNDAFKFNRESIFDTNLKEFESVIKKMKENDYHEWFNIFNEGIRNELGVDTSSVTNQTETPEEDNGETE